MNRKIKKHYLNIKKFGLFTEVKTLYDHKFKNDYTDYNLKIKRQKYYEELSKEFYEKELAEWYFLKTGNTLNLKNPQRFTEKIQWFKLYGFGEMETLLVDKYLVRNWVEKTIGGQYLIPIYGVWSDAKDIDYDTLPDSFVFKGNHGSQMNIIVENKKKINPAEVTKTMNQWLSLNFAHCLGGFEMQYENVPRRIIAEKLMIDDNLPDLIDYKFHCFNGTPKYCEVIRNRSTGETIDYFDMDWIHQDFIDEPETSVIKNSVLPIPKPHNFEEMKIVAKKLCEKFKYVRVDLYSINGSVYFGEMTFTPASGADRFSPDEADFKLGKLFDINGMNYCCK